MAHSTYLRKLLLYIVIFTQDIGKAPKTLFLAARCGTHYRLGKWKQGIAGSRPAGAA